MMRFLAGLLLTILIPTALMAAEPCPKNADPTQCLVCNIYHETRGEPLAGQLAVALVTLNRAASDLYPDDVCAVVWQASSKGPQFSWTTKRSKIMKEAEEVAKAEMVATLAMVMHETGTAERLTGIDETVMWFHSGPRPGWLRKFKMVAHIGGHYFYGKT